MPRPVADHDGIDGGAGRAGAAVPTPSLLRQAVRFAVVGAGNTLVSYLVILGLTAAVGLGVRPASIAAYGVGMLVSFGLNRVWTFGGAPQMHGAKVQALRFIAVNILCALLFAGVTGWVEPLFGLAIATIAGVLIATPVGFLLNRWLVFAAVPTDRRTLS